MRSGAVSLVGARNNNEDAYLLRDGDVLRGTALAQLAVADGMGGHASGEVASRLAVEGAAAGLANGLPDAAAIQRVFHHVDQQIRAYAATNAQGQAMGTTLTVALVHQSEAVIGHVGDTRAWLLHSGQLQQITADHSRIGRLLRAGAITEEDAIGHPEANVLEQALGAGDLAEVDVYRAGVGPGDVLLLSTDGLHGALSREEIQTVLVGNPSMQDACERLAALALERGSGDNITAVAWQYPRFATPTRTNPGSPVATFAPSDRPSANGTGPTGARGSSPRRGIRPRDERLPLLCACLVAGFIVGFVLGLMG